MTKLVIKGQEQDTEPTLEFSITKGLNGRIELRVGEVGGDTMWYIASVLLDGTLKIHSALPSMDFFRLETYGHIQVDYEE